MKSGELQNPQERRRAERRTSQSVQQETSQTDALELRVCARVCVFGGGNAPLPAARAPNTSSLSELHPLAPRGKISRLQVPRAALIHEHATRKTMHAHMFISIYKKKHARTHIHTHALTSLRKDGARGSSTLA